jgi:YggT family protein
MLTVIYFVNLIFQVYMLMLFARILASWVPQINEYRFMQFVGYYTDPYLNIFRRIIPPLGMFDLSPIVAFLCLSFMQNLVVNFLMYLHSFRSI